MNIAHRTCQTLGILLAPLIAHAHPGHDGDQSHSLALGVIFLVAAFLVIREGHKMFRGVARRRRP
jgi:hypothetical protein